MSRPTQCAKRSKRKRMEHVLQESFKETELRLLVDLLHEVNLSDLTRSVDIINLVKALREPHWTTIRVASESHPDSAVRDVQRELRHLFKSTRWNPPGLRRSYTPAEFFTIVMPLIQGLGHPRKWTSKSFRKFAPTAKQKSDEFKRLETIEAFYNWTMDQVRGILTDFGRMDRFLYGWCFVPERSPKGDIKYVLTINGVPADRATLIVDGERRTAVRCGHTSDQCEVKASPTIDWVSWNLDELGLMGPVRQLPVYVQMHVFERLYGRDGRLQALAHQENLLHDLVYRSLQAPVLYPCRNQSGNYLVEYGTEGCKLGYIVCEILPDKVVAKTFLFLTMDGTPEGQSLYQLLKVTRSDKSYLGIDDLRVLMTTDIQADPIIRRIFDKCQVSHLFEGLAFDGSLEPGHAAEFRRYLKLKNPGNSVAKRTALPVELNSVNH